MTAEEAAIPRPPAMIKKIISRSCHDCRGVVIRADETIDAVTGQASKSEKSMSPHTTCFYCCKHFCWSCLTKKYNVANPRELHEWRCFNCIGLCKCRVCVQRYTHMAIEAAEGKGGAAAGPAGKAAGGGGGGGGAGPKQTLLSAFTVARGPGGAVLSAEDLARAQMEREAREKLLRDRLEADRLAREAALKERKDAEKARREELRAKQRQEKRNAQLAELEAKGLVKPRTLVPDEELLRAELASGAAPGPQLPSLRHVVPHQLTADLIAVAEFATIFRAAIGTLRDKSFKHINLARLQREIFDYAGPVVADSPLIAGLSVGLLRLIADNILAEEDAAEEKLREEEEENERVASAAAGDDAAPEGGEEGAGGADEGGAADGAPEPEAAVRPATPVAAAAPRIRVRKEGWETFEISDLPITELSFPEVMRLFLIRTPEGEEEPLSGILQRLRTTEYWALPPADKVALLKALVERATRSDSVREIVDSACKRAEALSLGRKAREYELRKSQRDKRTILEGQAKKLAIQLQAERQALSAMPEADDAAVVKTAEAVAGTTERLKAARAELAAFDESSRSTLMDFETSQNLSLQLESLPLRPHLMGTDRRGASYWIFRSDLSRVMVEVKPDQWEVVSTPEDYQRLMDWLSPRGEREHELLACLGAWKDTVAKAMRPPSDEDLTAEAIWVVPEVPDPESLARTNSVKRLLDSLRCDLEEEVPIGWYPGGVKPKALAKWPAAGDGFGVEEVKMRLLELETAVSTFPGPPWARVRAEWLSKTTEATSSAQVALSIAIFAERISDRLADVEEAVCTVCSSGRSARSILLCDGCDKGYHTYCLTPRVEAIPKGKWFCPKCALERKRNTLTYMDSSEASDQASASNDSWLDEILDEDIASAVEAEQRLNARGKGRGKGKGKGKGRVKGKADVRTTRASRRRKGDDDDDDDDDNDDDGDSADDDDNEEVVDEEDDYGGGSDDSDGDSGGNSDDASGSGAGRRKSRRKGPKAKPKATKLKPRAAAKPSRPAVSRERRSRRIEALEVESEEDAESSVSEEGEEEEEEEGGSSDSTVCVLCNSGAHPSRLILCDKCDGGYHLYCLRPKLTSVPKGKWFCPSCVGSKVVVVAASNPSAKRPFSLLSSKERGQKKGASKPVQGRKTRGGGGTRRGGDASSGPSGATSSADTSASSSISSSSRGRSRNAKKGGRKRRKVAMSSSGTTTTTSSSSSSSATGGSESSSSASRRRSRHRSSRKSLRREKKSAPRRSRRGRRRSSSSPSGSGSSTTSKMSDSSAPIKKKQKRQ
jgi:hypothetical protein